LAVIVRDAVKGDEAAILGLVRGLAEYERLLGEVEASEELLAAALFCDAPRVFCLVAEKDGRAVGFALWFYTFSTFLGRHGIYLEDLFVESAERGAGIGRMLLRSLARRCVAEGLGRLEWSVLDWNEPAIGFYRRQGAAILGDWRICRLTGEALAAAAAS
jgi:GNAT superfamily N-acetyltransferase